MLVTFVVVYPEIASAVKPFTPAPPIPCRAVAKSATSVHDDPSHDSVTAVFPGLKPPYIKADVDEINELVEFVEAGMRLGPEKRKVYRNRSEMHSALLDLFDSVFARLSSNSAAVAIREAARTIPSAPKPDAPKVAEKLSPEAFVAKIWSCRNLLSSSTNSYTLELKSKAVFKEGLVVTADFQTGGKGQRGKEWESNRGENLLLSAVIVYDFISMGFIPLLMAIAIVVPRYLRWKQTKYYLSNDSLYTTMVGIPLIQKKRSKSATPAR